MLVYLETEFSKAVKEAQKRYDVKEEKAMLLVSTRLFELGIGLAVQGGVPKDVIERAFDGLLSRAIS